jgi:hypothetical protein
MSLKDQLANEHPDREVTNDELARNADKPQDANVYNGSKEE